MTTYSAPLAERMRPRTLDDLVGQSHLAGNEGVLRQLYSAPNPPSVIFWGPPGTGKTTLARILATQAGLPIFQLSAISSGVKDVREVIAQAREAGKAVLFIDEIHRFNKSQQDSLLAAVEEGSVVLIGATTENPSFEVIRPLLSRSQVYVLESLEEEELLRLVKRALEEDEEMKGREVIVQEHRALLAFSGGDARKLLNLLEQVVHSMKQDPVVITDAAVKKVAQNRMAAYDKGGEQHYDIISAFIKSIRGSDPNAAVYWLARMIEGGEDPSFIARRMVILASEDVGNANPNALLMATNCFQAVNLIGYPECRIILSQAAVYLACSPKSNASYMAIEEALSHVKKTGDLPVPLHLRNAPTNLMKQLNYGDGYKYAHAYDMNFVAQEFLPDGIAGMRFYDPGSGQREQEFRNFLKQRWKEKYGY